MTIRFWMVASGVVAAFGLLTTNLYQLQVERGAGYAERAEAQIRSAGFMAPTRGKVYVTDRYANRIAAATNKSYPFVFASPDDVADVAETAARLAAVFTLDADALQRRLEREGDTYELIASKPTDSQLAAIREAAMPGVYVDEQDFRFYPFGPLAAHVLGFVAPASTDDDVRGRYGVESYHDQTLAGTAGFLGKENLSGLVEGSDVYLTLDRNIQARAEEILRGLAETYRISGGSVVVQETKTGKLLAMANLPVFDPNEYARADTASFTNPAIQAVYEPGSVFKVITIAAGIDGKVISPETTYFDSGSLTLNGHTITNWDGKAHGTVTMREVIEQSINTGAAFAQQQIGRDDFYDYLVRFGFAEPTGIDLPAEISGSISNLTDDPRDINFATASFGQGVSVTPIQLISAVSAIGNKGVLMRPFITEGTEPQVVRRVTSASAAKAVTDMMVSAVEQAMVARIPNYRVAGKTGTAQVPDFSRGGYSDDFIHTYVGFVPVGDPNVTILIKIDRPRGATLAGLTVVPAFRELAEFVISYYGIPPDNLPIQ